VPLFSDVNECAKGIQNCSADAVCNNTKGSYNCTCNPGYYGDGWVCQGKLKEIQELLISEIPVISNKQIN